ncbi:MAG: LysR family transcriptional regulator [Novosphingobium sp.]|nr:LysR family transcriptional regulator [Novosphingobium sp.]
MFPGALKAFYEVARAGSIRKASEVMGVSPSSVSRQVAVLERQMGTRLVERSTGGVVLTHAGELVATFARAVILDFDTLKVDLDDMRGSRRRLIRIASVESIVSGGPPLAMAEFKRKYQDVSFQFSVMPAKQVLNAVKKDFCDIGITQNPPPDPDILSVAHVAEPVVLAVNSSHPFAGKEKVTLAELATIDLAVPDENFGVRAIMNDAFYREGLRPLPTMVSNSFEVLRSFISASNGAAIMPLRAVKDVFGGAHLIPIMIDSEPFRGGAIHIVTHAERRMPRILQAFVSVLAAHI